MSLLGRKVAPVLLISIILFSCEDPSEIALELNSNSDNFKINYVELPVTSSLIRADSLITYSQFTQNADLMAGTYRDPIFGTISAKAFTELRPNTFPILSEDAVFDSLILYLKISSIHGEGVSGKVQIAKLANPLDVSREYYSFDTIEEEIDFRSGEKSIGETFISSRSGIGDTVRIELKKQVGLVIFDSLKSGAGIINPLDNFNEYFNGISIDIVDTESTIFNFDQNDDETKMLLYWHDVLPSDTTFGEIEFKLDNQVLSFNNLVNDSTGTIFENLPPTFEEFNPANGFAYYNGSIGLFTKLDISAIGGFFDTLNSVIINRADLVIEGLESGDQFVFPPETFRYFFAGEDNRIAIDSNAISPPFFRALKQDRDFLLLDPEGTGADEVTISYDSTSNSYRAPISFYLQALFDGALTPPNIILHSHDVILDNSNKNFKYHIVSLNRFVVREENIKLKIFYTVPE